MTNGWYEANGWSTTRPEAIEPPHAYKTGQNVRLSDGQRAIITELCAGYNSQALDGYQAYRIQIIDLSGTKVRGGEMLVQQYQITPTDFGSRVSNETVGQCQQAKTMEKFYRVVKDTPVWLKGAIVRKGDDSDQYSAVNDIWNSEETPELTKYLDNRSITEMASVIENCPSWYERVYKVSSLKGMYYVVKDKMQDIMSKTAVNKDGEVEQGE